MIKNYLDADDDDSLITKQSFGEPPPDKKEFEEFAAPFSAIEESKDSPEIIESSAAVPEISENEEFAAEPMSLDPLIETPFDVAGDVSAETFQTSPAAPSSALPAAEVSEKTNGDRYANDAPLFQSAYQSESSDETIRKSGLAYSAAIILFASIVFTLILGWFADLLFGTSPWGKVGGIILGSIIGFIQFFRTTSQLFKNKD